MDKLNECYVRTNLWVRDHPYLTVLILLMLALAVYIGVEASHGH